MKNTKWISISKAYKDYAITEKLVSLNNSFELLALFQGLGKRLIVACFHGTVNLPSRSKQAYIFGKHLLRMRKHHGVTFTVNYLKVSQLTIQKQIAKDLIKSARDLEPLLPLPRLSSSRLPNHIPLGDRRAICKGNHSIIRWWLTLYSVYRVLEAPSKLKLNTITDKFSGDLGVLDQVSLELAVLAASFKKRNHKALNPIRFLWLETSSPSCRTSWNGMVSDIVTFAITGRLHLLRFFIDRYGSYNVKRLIKSVFALEKYWDLAWVQGYAPVKDSYLASLGQLAIKKEAAGKVRVFALVDVWTQSVLKPLHDWLFDFLRSLPNDGTFDQYASIKRCMQKVKISKKSFGYDLSAATDRLPIELQTSILGALFDKEYASSWKELLVGREYHLENKEFGDHSVKYSVGQPMGALSSWAMLAVTHHLIVQYCAKVTGRSRPGLWYDNYELLGDDIILFDEVVAKTYLSLMEGIGVGITLSKSVVSNNETIEFAKVTGYNGVDVSAVSWKMFMSQRSMMGRVSILYQFLIKDKAPSTLIKWVKNMVRLEGKDQGVSYSYSLLALLSKYVNTGQLPIGVLSRALTDVLNPRRQAYKNSLEQAPIRRLESLLVALVRKTELPSFEKGNRFWWQDEMSMKGSIHKQVESFIVRRPLHQTLRDTAADIFAALFSRGFWNPSVKNLTKDAKISDLDNVGQFALTLDSSARRDHPAYQALGVVRDCILQFLIEESKAPMIRIYSATFYTLGIPSYFMGTLEQEDLDQLKALSALDTFGQPLDEYWMVRLKDIEQMNTIFHLPHRAYSKLWDDAKPETKLDSPLKPMRQFLSGRREWTKKYG